MLISHKKIINAIPVASWVLVIVMFFFYGPYTKYKREQIASAIDCDVVMVSNKHNDFKLHLDLNFVDLHYVTLKTDQREWKHLVDQKTYNSIQVGDWTKYCRSGERPIPWFDKIVK